jgi:hypothetical protein
MAKDMLLRAVKTTNRLRAKVRRGALEISVEMTIWLAERNIRSARGLVSHLRSCPGAYVVRWEMTLPEVRSFLARILWDLRLNLDRGTLVKHEPMQVSYGALPVLQ